MARTAEPAPSWRVGGRPLQSVSAPRGTATGPSGKLPENPGAKLTHLRGFDIVAPRPRERLTSKTSPRGPDASGPTWRHRHHQLLRELCAMSIMCSLKTEQRKVQKRVRASASVASANDVDVQVNFRIILKDN